MKKPVVIFGSGAHGRVILDNILSNPDEFQILGFVDSVKDIGTLINSFPIIGKQYELQYLFKKFGRFSGIVAIGDNFSREKLVNEITNQIPDFEFINAIHRSVEISQSAKIGVGNVIMPGVIINSQAIIEDHCIINTNSSVEHNCMLKNFSSISAGVTTGGYVTIGVFSAIALSVTIFDKINIGSNVVVGSGSLVTKDIEDDVLAYGIPAKVIRKREKGEKFL